MYVFNDTEARKADSGSAIDSSGVYKGMITKAIDGMSEGGASFVEFELQTDEGQTSKFVRLYTSKKDGSPSFGAGIIQALMGLLGLNELNSSLEGDERLFKILENKKVGFALQKEWYLNRDYEKKWKMSLLHFFDYSTMKTYSEKSKNMEAKCSTRHIKDKELTPEQEDQLADRSSCTDDGCPF